MTGASRFWDRMAERYAKRPISDQETYDKKLELTRDYLHPDMEVLELGCGTGTNAIAHAGHVKHIQAIDISVKMIEIAQRKAGENSVENITFERSTIDEFKAPDQSFDAAFGLNILHLVEDKNDVISKVGKMLKPGGVFVTNTPCIADTMKYFRFIAPIGKFLGLLPMVKIFSTRDLEESLTGAGFEIDLQWLPPKSKAVFIVAKKAGP